MAQEYKPWELKCGICGYTISEKDAHTNAYVILAGFMRDHIIHEHLKVTYDYDSDVERCTIVGAKIE